MKLIIVLVAFLAVASARRMSVADRQIAETLPQESNLSRANLETELRALLEKLRAIMETGSEENGIPILDPLFIPIFNVTVDIPSAALLKIDATHINIIGLKEFIVNQISFTILRLRLDFDIAIPLIKVLAEYYELDGNVMEQFHVFGNGAVDVEALDIQFSGYATVKIVSGHLAINKVEIEAKLGGFKSDISGLLGGGEVSDVLNKILEELIPGLVETQAEGISTYLAELITEIADGFLNDLTLQDLIDLITGGGNVFEQKNLVVDQLLKIKT